MNRRPFAVLEGRPATPEERREAIEAELRALPELEAPREVWRVVEERLGAAERERPYLWRALAATVAAASLTAVVLLYGRDWGPAPHEAAPAAVPADGVSVAAFMERSRLAETRRRGLPVVRGGTMSPLPGVEARRLLAARIASVDASLNRLAGTAADDPGARERLWRERAELMDTLARAEQVQREALIRYAVH